MQLGFKIQIPYSGRRPNSDILQKDHWSKTTRANTDWIELFRLCSHSQKPPRLQTIFRLVFEGNQCRLTRNLGLRWIKHEHTSKIRPYLILLMKDSRLLSYTRKYHSTWTPSHCVCVYVCVFSASLSLLPHLCCLSCCCTKSDKRPGSCQRW